MISGNKESFTNSEWLLPLLILETETNNCSYMYVEKKSTKSYYNFSILSYPIYLFYGIASRQMSDKLKTGVLVIGLINGNVLIELYLKIIVVI